MQLKICWKKEFKPKDCNIYVNNEQVFGKHTLDLEHGIVSTIEFQERTFNELMIKNYDRPLENLWIDGIDMENFRHHCVQLDDGIKYFFRTPVWRFMMDFLKYDYTTFPKFS